MIYTVRYAHLKYPAAYKTGNRISRFDIIGTMGNTGQSGGDHLHIDVVEGEVNKIIRLSEIGYEKEKPYKPNIAQLNYFIDSELFNFPILVTTYFYDPSYKKIYDKDHPAYDVVPFDRKETDEHFKIYWNRSKPGRVLAVGEDAGYGNYILIGLEV